MGNKSQGPSERCGMPVAAVALQKQRVRTSRLCREAIPNRSSSTAKALSPNATTRHSLPRRLDLLSMLLRVAFSLEKGARPECDSIPLTAFEAVACARASLSVSRVDRAVQATIDSISDELDQASIGDNLAAPANRRTTPDDSGRQLLSVQIKHGCGVLPVGQ